MATVFDVAKYILEKSGPMSAMKLQKLVFYSQAWSLCWDDAPIFNEHIEAWANGPVVPALYDAHRGLFNVAAANVAHRAANQLSEIQTETIDAVLDAYGHRSAQWLSDQTHSERPWQKAREGLGDSERSNAEITLESLGEYYSSL